MSSTQPSPLHPDRGPTNNRTSNYLMTMKRHHYAITYPCGVATSASTGGRYGTYHRFDSRKGRDEWVASGEDFRTSPDYRESIPASDPEIRALIRRENDDLMPRFATEADRWQIEDMAREEAAHWDQIAAEATCQTT